MSNNLTNCEQIIQHLSAGFKALSLDNADGVIDNCISASIFEKGTGISVSDKSTISRSEAIELILKQAETNKIVPENNDENKPNSPHFRTSIEDLIQKFFPHQKPPINDFGTKELPHQKPPINDFGTEELPHQKPPINDFGTKELPHQKPPIDGFFTPRNLPFGIGTIINPPRNEDPQQPGKTDNLKDVDKPSETNKPKNVDQPNAIEENNPAEMKNPSELSCSTSGIDLIRKLEGCKLKAYQCSANAWTIGYGHTKNVQKGDTITQEQAEKYLKEDIKTCERFIRKKVKVPLTQNQFDALVSFVFNVGVGNFEKSTLLKKLNKGDYKGAADELLRWNKIKKNGKYVVSQGLNNRRQKERELFLKQ